MFTQNILKSITAVHKQSEKARIFLRYMGPGVLVTVGFIDPGNWACNLVAGAQYGYLLLWVITLGTLILILLQHNVAKLGIVSGLCLSEAAALYVKPVISKTILASAYLAAVATVFAEIIGSALALNMLFNIPLKLGAIIASVFSLWLLKTNSYQKLEKYIIAFVALIGTSFIYQLTLPHIQWAKVFSGAFYPVVPHGSLLVIISMLGAVVMPHNLFLHSEIIQNKFSGIEGHTTIESKLKFEFYDTLFSMLAGWGINSAIIIVAASTFFSNNVQITELQQAQVMLKPILGDLSAIIFAIALLFAGISSSVTAGIAGSNIFAGLFKEAYDITDIHTELGAFMLYFIAVLLLFFIDNPLNGLIISQVLLSFQVSFTVFLQIYLTSSKNVMGKYANSGLLKISLWTAAIVITSLNVWLLLSLIN